MTTADRYLALVRDAVLGALTADMADPRVRDHLENGRGWVEPALTMVGRKRLDDLARCIRTVVADGVPGDVCETGVWRGGACIFARACLAALGDGSRIVWACDSFRGLPPAASPKEHGFYCHDPRLAVSQEQVRENFARIGLLDERVRFVEGWFRDTLRGAPIERLSVLRLDGDMHESTTDALEALYPRLSPGGFLIVDDYGAVEPCRDAVREYRERCGIAEPIEMVDWTCARWRKAAG